MKTFLKKTGAQFFRWKYKVQSTKIENVTFPNKASIKTTKLGKENGATGRNGAFPVTTL